MGGEGVKGGGSKVGEKGGGRNQRSQHPSGVCQFGLLCVSVRLDAELCGGWLCGGGKEQRAFASFAFLLLATRYVTVCVGLSVVSGAQRPSLRLSYRTLSRKHWGSSSCYMPHRYRISPLLVFLAMEVLPLDVHDSPLGDIAAVPIPHSFWLEEFLLP